MAPPVQAPSESSVESALLLVGIFVLVLGRRSYAMVRGTPYSPTRIYGFAAFALVVYLLFAASTFVLAYAELGLLTVALAAPYVLVVVASAALARPHVHRVVRFETRVDGLTYYRIPWLVPAAYLALFAARFALEVLLFGTPSLFVSGASPTAPSGTLALLVVFDLLYGASLGLLVGRSQGIVDAFRERGPASAPPAPRAPSGGADSP